jgi:hypothetical protein
MAPFAKGRVLDPPLQAKIVLYEDKVQLDENTLLLTDKLG